MENHALVPCGKKIMNWKNPPCADTFIDRRGNKAKVPRTKASGIHFRTMELNHENEGVVFQIGNVLLHDSVILDWDRWQPHDRGVAPNGKRIGDTFASHILEEAIRINPEQADELSSYRAKIRA
jgi:hypothetical protein